MRVKTMKPHQEELGPVLRNTSIDGQIYSIGGKDKTIKVHLRNGDSEQKCVVSIELARKLAPYLLAGTVRLFGYGYWYRLDSLWQMKTFTAVDFAPLDSQTLNDTVENIRAIFHDLDPEDFMKTMAELRQPD